MSRWTLQSENPTQPNLIEPPPELVESPPRWQFTLSWLLIFMAVVSIAASLFRHVPTEVSLLFFLYAAAMSVYFLIRLPVIFQFSKRRQIEQHRRELLNWAGQLRQAKSAGDVESETSRNAPIAESD